MENGIFEFGSMREILTILFKYKRTILITWAVVFVGCVIGSFFLNEPSYGVRSVLLVKFGREFVGRPEVGDERPRTAMPFQAIVTGEISILSSRDLLQKVVNSVGPLVLYPELIKEKKKNGNYLGSAVAMFEKNLKITNLPGNLIEVSFNHNDPVTGAKAVNLLVDLFKEKHLAIFSGEGTSFLEAQKQTFQGKLTEAETELAGFKQKHGVYSFQEQRTLQIQQRNTLDTNLKNAQSQVRELEQKAAFIKSPRWSTDVPSELRNQLSSLEQREREARSKYKENSRMLQNIHQEIEALKGSINRGREETRQIELSRVEGELSVARARSQSLQRQLAQIAAELQGLDSRERELQQLQRQTALQESNLRTYSQKLEESLIMDDMDSRKMVSVSVVEKAMPPSKPKKEKFGPLQLILGGFIGGFAVSAGLALILGFLSPSMISPFSAERRLNLPVMVAVANKG
ncbi:MAG: Chromosome partition protein Smc [Syntrophorhabdus sp. PtaU1.Bin153]|nr:MAG: Chromosome partition protein Smc [Syntrophorhabdus sp. PtaU1.Bin153]